MSQIEDLPGVFTSTESAEYLRISKATLLRLANKGLIEGVKIGRQWRFSKEVILGIMRNPDLLNKLRCDQ